MNIALSLSREERAFNVLTLCEYAARGIVPDLDDSEDQSIAMLCGSYEALATKLRYLTPRSSAQWKPEFERALESSHSMRVEMIDISRKQTIGGGKGKCMACGQNESNCRYSIDLSGTMNPREWLSGPGRVCDSYALFKKEYESVYNANFVENCVRKGRLPKVDKGCFVVGQTCLRKAKLRYSIQTLLLEACYACERDLEKLKINVGSDEFKAMDAIYTITDEKCKEFVNRQDTLELAVADEKRYAPDVLIDNELWAIIDRCRNNVSGGSGRVIDSMITERANKTLRGLRPGGSKCEEHSEDEDEVEVSDDSEASDSSCEELPQKRKVCGRKRTCVVEDESSDEERDSRLRGHGYATRNSESKRVKSGSPSKTPSSTGPRTSGPAEAEATLQDDRPAASASVSKSHRLTPLSISGMVGMQRAAGILSSRNEAVVQLMELQVRLAKNRNHRDATVCTNAILTLQELVQKVEELSHTVGI